MRRSPWTRLRASIYPRWLRNGTIDAVPELFESFEDEGQTIDIDAANGQRQGFGDLAASEVKHFTEEADFPLRFLGRRKESGSLGRGQIHTVARGIDQVAF